jgi:CheY-like chemotaxis protein
MLNPNLVGCTFHDVSQEPRSATEKPIQLPRVLVVEDHDDTRFMLRTVLEMFDFAVVEATDGKSAIETATLECPDLILMDLTLPEVDGLVATRTIRSKTVLADVPIIFLSGRAELTRRHEAFEAGCNDFLIKPVEIDRMIGVIRRWLRPGEKNSPPQLARAQRAARA